MLGPNPTPTHGQDEPNHLALLAVRVGIPVVLAVVGVVMIVIGHGKENSPVAVTGLVLMGVGLMVWMLNWMYRMSVESGDDRAKEEEARDFFTLHGYWPDDAP